MLSLVLLGAVARTVAGWIHKPDLIASRQVDPELRTRLEDVLRENDRLRSEAELLKSEQADLLLAREMLELRTLTDLEFSSPRELMQVFLAKLAALADYDRVSLYLQDESSALVKLFAWGGAGLSGRDTSHWQRSEESLIAHVGTVEKDIRVWDDSSLKELSPPPLFRSGAAVSVVHEAEPIGCLLLTARDARLPSATDRRLLLWSAEFLVQTLTKAMHQVQIEDQARRDALTQLANRRIFDQELAMLVESSSQTRQSCGLVLIDLDHFKSINDTWGHAAGDFVLKTVAARMLRLVAGTRVSDRPLVARYGGEEFAILLPGVGTNGATRIAEVIRRDMEREPIRFNGQDLLVTLSAGVAVAPQQGSTPQTLFDAADAALYSAKHSGRNRVIVAKPYEGQAFAESRNRHA